MDIFSCGLAPLHFHGLGKGGLRVSGGSLLSVAALLVCMAVGREGLRASTFFFARPTISFPCSRGAMGGVFGGSLPSGVVRLVCVPAGREDERAGQFFLWHFRRLISTDCMMEGKSVQVSSYSLRCHF